MDANITVAKANYDNSVKEEKKKKSKIPWLFGSKRKGRENLDEIRIAKPDIVVDGAIDHDLDRKIASIFEEDFVPRNSLRSSSERHLVDGDQTLSLSNFECKMALAATSTNKLRIFVATWNVGGKIPHDDLNLEDFLQAEGSSDIYVLGFQEVVPLSAGNILVIEDNEPAAKWLDLINQALNTPKNDYNVPEDSRKNNCANHSKLSSNKESNKHSLKSGGGLHFFQKPSLKVLSKALRADSAPIKSCNCPEDFSSRERPRRLRKRIDSEGILSPRYGSCDDELFAAAEIPLYDDNPKSRCYSLVVSKQMVGIFVSVWVRSDLVPHVSHLRVSSVGRGIMGCLGNKGCISISMSLHKTSFCFVCSHLASGEKEGDELKRNADVAEILKSTHFSKLCKSLNRRDPQRITAHDRVIWFGDLNYRVSLSYEEARILLENNDWDTLLEKDQLNMERNEKRVFEGFKEGLISFAPTYKYSHNSDSYAGESVKSKKKRRTPAWCDRILWRGNGMEQLSYIRGESRLSDHRPVCSIFSVEVSIIRNDVRFITNGFTCLPHRLDFDECVPQRHSFCD